MMWNKTFGFGITQRKISFTREQMSEEQYALPTLVQKTAIIGVRNIYDYPLALLELQDTFKRSLNLPY